MMNANMLNIYAEVFEGFIMNFPNLVQQMKECDHGLCRNATPSPWHMEGDVWTHTCMCYSSVKFSNQLELIPEYDLKIVLLSILFHDIGKPYARLVTESDYVTFRGHDQLSVVHMIDNIEPICDVFDLTYDESQTSEADVVKTGYQHFH